jgi:OmcA/MtrC family decaheme c-type cytochrome
VDFTVVDSKGDPAEGIAAGSIDFTIAKLVENTDPAVNGGLPYWQSYINRARTSDEPGGLTDAIQATNEDDGTLVETSPGVYQYTYITDIANVTEPIPVAYDPTLTHRVGIEIRLSNAAGAEGPLAPDNPVYDFVPDGSDVTFTKNIVATESCNGCHYEFAMHGDPRKSMEYCVTCHNPGSVDPDTGNSVDFGHMVHSIHMGEDRIPGFQVIGYGGNVHDYSHVTYPQSKTYCETCHDGAVTDDGDAWNEGATAKTCGGCHADGLLAANHDAVTGQAVYQFDHTAAGADAPIGTVDDGQCASCHLGSIGTAGPALAIHSNIRGDDRARAEAGDNFVFEFLGAVQTGPGETPTATIRVKDAAGIAYDIINDPEFDLLNGASLNLYVQWATDDYYGGDENGLVLGGRINDNLSTEAIQALDFRDTGYAIRMRLGAIQAVAIPNVNPPGSYDVPFYRALPADFTGDVAFALGGHPAFETTDADGVTAYERAAPVSAVYFPGTPRVAAFDSAQCNACHNRLMEHGANRNGNAEFCLICHNSDAAVCQSPAPDAGGACPGGQTNEGYHFGRMVHSIHTASTTFKTDGGGDFSHVTYPQYPQNCFTCHEEGLYNTARATARAVSTDQGGDIRIWTDDIATTPTAAVCGVCHTSTAAKGHFESQGGQVDAVKNTIAGAGAGLPNGQEACAVCHGTGSEFETSKFHKATPGVPEHEVH